MAGELRPFRIEPGIRGELYGTFGHLLANAESPDYPSFLVQLRPKERPLVGEHYDPATATAERLWSELSTISWIRRRTAHHELLRRGESVLAEAAARLNKCLPNDPALEHLPWLVAASGSDERVRLLRQLMQHENPNVRLQVVRIVENWPEVDEEHAILDEAIRDENARVRLAAMAAIYAADDSLTHHFLTESVDEHDTYHRMAATALLARHATMEQLTHLMTSASDKQRLLGVLACGFRLSVPPPHYTPHDKLLTEYPLHNAKTEIQYFDEEIDLAEVSTTGCFTTPEYWAAIKKNHHQSFAALVECLDDSSPRVRHQARFFLSLLDDPRTREMLESEAKSNLLESLKGIDVRPIAELWHLGPLPEQHAQDGSMAEPHRVEINPIDLSRQYEARPLGQRGASDAGQVNALQPGQNSSVQQASFISENQHNDVTVGWTRIASDLGQYHIAEANPEVSHFFYFRIQSPQSQVAIVVLDVEGSYALTHNGRRTCSSDPVHVAKLDKGQNEFLLRVASAGTVQLGVRARDEVGAAVPQTADSMLNRRLLSSSTESPADLPDEFQNMDWDAKVAAADPERGRRLFGTDGLGCIKCHAVETGQRGRGAPSLLGAKERFTVAALVEAIMIPSKKVAPNFQTSVVITAGGRVVDGLITSKGKEHLEVLRSNAILEKIALDEVEETYSSPNSPMPSGLVKTPDELADIVAYLLAK